MITCSELKECLDRALQINEQVSSIEKQIQYCRYKASGRSLSFSVHPGSGRSDRGSSQEYWIERAAKWQDKLYYLENEKLDIMLFATGTAKRLQDQRELLFVGYRYILLMKCSEIETKENLSQPQVWRILTKALEHMTEIVNHDPDLERKYQKVMDSKSA